MICTGVEWHGFIHNAFVVSERLAPNFDHCQPDLAARILVRFRRSPFEKDFDERANSKGVHLLLGIDYVEASPIQKGLYL